jgi:hypothetical protein
MAELPFTSPSDAHLHLGKVKKMIEGEITNPPQTNKIGCVSARLHEPLLKQTCPPMLDGICSSKWISSLTLSEKSTPGARSEKSLFAQNREASRSRRFVAAAPGSGERPRLRPNKPHCLSPILTAIIQIKSDVASRAESTRVVSETWHLDLNPNAE